MTDQPTSADRIVVAIDGSEAARAALRWALAEARTTGATIEAVHVWHQPVTLPLPGMPAVPVDEARSWAETLLRNELAKLRADTADIEVRPTAVEGPPALRLTEIAAGALLLVVGARGSGLSATLGLGSVSQQCAQLSTVPVAVIRDDLVSRVPRNRVAVGVDGSDESLRALAWAASHARRHGVPLQVVMAWSFLRQPQPDGEPLFDDPFDQTSADEVLRDLLGRQADALGDVDVTRTAVSERPARALVDAAADADLVVVGARGLGGFKRLALGSVSHQVVHHSPSPVVIVPHRYEGGAGA